MASLILLPFHISSDNISNILAVKYHWLSITVACFLSTIEICGAVIEDFVRNSDSRIENVDIDTSSSSVVVVLVTLSTKSTKVVMTSHTRRWRRCLESYLAPSSSTCKQTKAFAS